jgi:hypothetical protein
MEDIITQVLNWLMSSAELVASEGFRIALQQAHTIAIVNSIFATISLIGMIIFIVVFFKSDDNDTVGMAIFSFLLFLISFGIFFCEALVRFLNPEYYAIRIIMQLVR